MTCLAALPEDIDVVVYQTASEISTFAPSIVPRVRAPFSMNFMFPVPDASLEARLICSERSHAGISHLSSRDIVVFYKDKLHPFGNFRVILASP